MSCEFEESNRHIERCAQYETAHKGSESAETGGSISDEVWMIQPKFESKFCLYKNQLHGTCMAKGGDGSKCARNICPCKVPRGPIEYAESLYWEK